MVINENVLNAIIQRIDCDQIGHTCFDTVFSVFAPAQDLFRTLNAKEQKVEREARTIRRLER